MRIKNIDNFRTELFKAIIDANPYFRGEPTIVESVIKTGYEDERMTKYDIENGYPSRRRLGDDYKVVALPKVLMLGNTGYYVEVDYCGDICFWHDLGDYFDFDEYVCISCCQSKMSAAMKAMQTLERIYNEEV